MKLLFNSTISKSEFKTESVREITFEEWQRDCGNANYWCIDCGEPDSISAEYSVIAHGTAALIGSDGELSDLELSDSDGFEIQRYSCCSCGADHSRLEEAITEDAHEAFENYCRHYRYRPADVTSLDGGHNANN